MSRPSFIGILLLTCGLILMAGLVLWHHERLNQLDQQIMQLRLEKKLLRAGPVPIEPEAPVVQSLPGPLPPLTPRQRQAVEPAEQGEESVQMELVPTESETPKLRSLPKPPRQRQTAKPAEQGKKPPRMGSVPIEPEASVIQSLPGPLPPLTPRQRQAVEPAEQGEESVQMELVPTESETPKLRSLPKPPRQRQTVEPSEQDETRRLTNSLINEECQRRGQSTDTLGETWRCVGTPLEGKK